MASRKMNRIGGNPEILTVRRNVSMGKAKEYNYLKYWRVARKYILHRYKITGPELDIFLYLYDEDAFTREMFLEYCATLKWNNQRLNEMIAKGYIKLWRDGARKQKNLYVLTQGTRRICTLLYKKLAGENIQEIPRFNDMMRGSCYSDKVYSTVIKKMNAARDESRRLGQLPQGT
jgi:DNA-binding MarR family transcriptional regulator